MLDILFVTDFVCPYCLVAKEALGQALEEMGIQADIRIQPMELTEEPQERVDTYHDEKRKARYQVLVEPARQLGLDMKLPPAVSPRPYTRLAFEGWHFAEEKGWGRAYSDLMYRAYFIEEKDIGDLEVLVQLAERAGLETDSFRQALLAGVYSEKQREACTYSRKVLQVTGVPTIYVNGQKVMLKDYTKEEMVRILREKTRENGKTEK
ncbi:MAG: DsbA family protein [Lachnospiraceae bacterium]|nr:DsbA family protein [Lachnospiraceae bacterium]